MCEKATTRAMRRLVVMALAAACLIFGAREARALTCGISPDQVPIDLSYHGSSLVVQGSSSPGRELIVKVSSGREDALLKYMGKAGGLFWMKMGDMEFKNVPHLYLVYTTGEIERFLAADEQVRHGIGYPAIKDQAEIAGRNLQVDKDHWFDQFLKFKQHENLYLIKEGVITRRHGAESDEYRLEIAWPYQAPPGTYTVEALAVQDGRIVDTASTSVEVKRVGAVEQISQLAFNRSAVYGAMAVVVAMAAGFAVGVLFKKGGGAH